MIGSFIADFCCFRPRLVIELDGSQHMEQVEYDQRRTDFLISEGFKVIRFWDNQVLKEADSVLEAIFEALKAPLTPSLSHKGRGRRVEAHGD